MDWCFHLQLDYLKKDVLEPTYLKANTRQCLIPVIWWEVGEYSL